MRDRLHFIFAVAVALLALAVASQAQTVQQAPSVVARATSAEVTAEGGAVVTAVFTLANVSADTAHFTTSLALPKGWTAVFGSAPSMLAPSAKETWLASIALPSSAVAGRYTIRGTVTEEPAGAARTTSDSIVVVVSERREIEVLAIDSPGWVLSGSKYEARFLVRNRGNVASTINLNGTTSRGSRAAADPSSITLMPGASARVLVHIVLSLQLTSSTDDVIELTAVDAIDSSVNATASARTIVVPGAASAGGLATIPAMLSVRTVGGAAGVSPIVLTGAGKLGESNTAVDFFLQAPTGQQSPYGFGERDEYRVSVQSDRFRVRLGDNLYGYSLLTSSGVMGTGADARGTVGFLNVGAYAQKMRWTPGTPAEQGAFLETSGDSALRGLATMVTRQSANGTPSSVAALSGEARLGKAAALVVEGARSDSVGAADNAYRARLSGNTRAVTYELGVLHGGDQFAGPARGVTYKDGSLSTRVWHALEFTASGSVDDWGGGPASAAAPAQRISNGSVAANWGGAATVEYGWLSRSETGSATSSVGSQQGVRVSGARQVGPLALSASVEHGVVNNSATGLQHAYSQYSLAFQTNVGSLGAIGVSSAYNVGQTLMGAGDGFLNTGVNAQIHLPFALEFGATASAQRATFGVLDSSGAWFSVTDVRLDRRWENGSTLGLHARRLQTPSVQGAANSNAVYLEYRRPLHIPTGPLRAPGRATGRVTNAETGKPVAGVLVRLGDQAAVTDRDGRVSFAGLKPLEYPVSIDASRGAAGAMLIGDVMVDMREPSSRAVNFEVKVTRGAQISGVIHRFAPRSTIGAGADSLVQSGALADALVALQGARDTVYQATDDRGRVDFGAVAPGAYTLVVLAKDAPDQTKFERERIGVTVKPGERQDIEFRLLPKPRTVQFMNGGAELKATIIPKKQ